LSEPRAWRKMSTSARKAPSRPRKGTRVLVGALDPSGAFLWGGAG